jgi:hypothetical protein
MEMRRISAFGAGMIGLLTIILSLCLLWLAWGNRIGLLANLEPLKEGGPPVRELSAPLIGSQPADAPTTAAEPSGDKMVTLPDVQHMDGAKVSLQPLGGPHVLGQQSADEISPVWPRCAQTPGIQNPCGSWVLRPVPQESGEIESQAPQPLNAYRFKEGEVGESIGMGMDLKNTVLTVLFTVLIGMVFLNAVKEDPIGEDRNRRLMVFALGACAYTAILLMAR